jgi:uncharacterized protein DUF5132
MALLEDMLKAPTAAGLAIGIGALVFVPGVLPTIGRVLRPAAKAAIKGGMVFYRETIAELGEAANDLVAEARAEIAQESVSMAVPAPAKRAARGEKN